jgi:hypothetical protein
MPRNTGDEEPLTKDEIAHRKLGPRGVPGGPDTSKMTPQQKRTFPRQGSSTVIPLDRAKLRLAGGHPTPLSGPTSKHY